MRIAVRLIAFILTRLHDHHRFDLEYARHLINEIHEEANGFQRTHNTTHVDSCLIGGFRQFSLIAAMDSQIYCYKTLEAA